MKSNLKINSITSTVDIIMKNNLTSMKEHTLDFNTSKENNLNETNPHKLKGQFSNVMSKKLFLKKFELLNINENSDGNEQDLMIEQCNRIEVHDLDKWLDFNKSRICKNMKKINFNPKLIILKHLILDLSLRVEILQKI